MPPDATRRSYFDPLVLAKIATMSLRARHVVEGLLSGLHDSPYRGYSVEFAEHREYVPGDEIRRIDWKAYGKFNRYFIKEYEEETNLRAYILVDASASMAYGSAELSKFDYSCYLAASLAYLMLHQGDDVGLVTFGAQVQRYIPPRGGVQHMRTLAQQLEATRPEGKTHLDQVLRELAGKLTRRGLIIVISDLFDDPDVVMRALRYFRHRRNEVMVFHVLDKNELEFPFQRLTVFEDIEDAAVRILSEPRTIRAAYVQQLEAFLTEYQRACRRETIDYQLFPTTTPLDVALTRYLARRQ
ncbi:MAG: DUF58 domain-containing protein [Candidatus Tectomicrobia bacterium]|uniref:DUF58 domain-containing protein n=1 Tax=Tectimicrobiota bacterium TaxID=2528274 RepID=A0A938B3Y3_UNCTE|nr:DUF58 domain-containing protein [Candidatus Tectomicrobia bacterium]